MPAQQQLRIFEADEKSINALLQDFLQTQNRSAIEHGLPGPSMSSPPLSSVTATNTASEGGPAGPIR
ncbi:hypothetical protein N658DRAFT_501123 [Parathielavia hyrcaniae]|uniref:Uncharacterized protein n=1 Tax=Parathielavia hyrcaniae TaxID=113614 RepID=A0AAN6SXC8_9PEZI|nr:hypothetical protein N658DRAFT_501123 [Parathielavia hyrcaniae]